MEAKTYAQQLEIREWVKESRRVWRRIREMRLTPIEPWRGLPTPPKAKSRWTSNQAKPPTAPKPRSSKLGRPSVGQYRGVSEKAGRFRAQIRIGKGKGKVEHLGMFDTAIEAARAWDAEAIKIHGVKAKLNFPTEAIKC